MPWLQGLTGLRLLEYGKKVLELDQQLRFLKLGANLLIHSADILLFHKHLRTELEAIKKAAGVCSSTDDAREDINI